MNIAEYTVNESELVVQYGVSEELLGWIEALRQAPGENGAKYRPQDVDTVARELLCRDYGDRCYELAHLLALVNHSYMDAACSPLLTFFWVDEIVTAPRFRQAFCESTTGLPSSTEKIALTVEQQRLLLGYPDGEFGISYSRIGLLAAFWEFIVTVNPAWLERAASAIQDPSLASAKKLASYLQAFIYDMLSEHTKTAQVQKRLYFIGRWLGQAGLTAADISDELVFNFWQQAFSDEDAAKVGYRRFRTVADDFIAYQTAITLESTAQQIQRAATIGYQTDDCEISPDQLSSALETCEIVESYHWLSQTPKFASKKTLDSLEPMVSLGNSAVSLPLTCVRCKVLGDWQAKLLQAVRDKNADRFKEYLLNGPAQQYAHYIQGLATGVDVLWQAKYSGIHVLTAVQDLTGVIELLELLPETTLAELRLKLPDLDMRRLLIAVEEGMDAGSSDVDRLVTLFYRELASLALQLPALNQVLRDLRAAFKANNREGFRTLPGAVSLGPYVAGVEALTVLIALVNKSYESMAAIMKANSEGEAIFAADVSITRHMMENMYGDFQW